MELVWAYGTASKVTGPSVVSCGPRRDDPAQLNRGLLVDERQPPNHQLQSGPDLTAGSYSLSGLAAISLVLSGAWYTVD